MILTPGKYSLFLLHENGTWIQPTFRVKAPMEERDFEAAAMNQYGRKYFHACSVCPDEECPDDEYVQEFDEEGV